MKNYNIHADVLHGKKTVVALRWYEAKQEKKIHLIYIKFGSPVIWNTIYLLQFAREDDHMSKNIYLYASRIYNILLKMRTPPWC